MKKPLLYILLLTILLPAAAGDKVPQVMDEYEKKIYKDSLNFKMPFRILTPSPVVKGQKYPLVIFLHGAGERGDDNESQLTYGAGFFSNPVNTDRYPAYVIFPQCSSRSWVIMDGEKTFRRGNKVPEESIAEKTLMNLIDNVIRSCPIDESRIYIMGLSMGAIAAYDLVCRYPDRFAAAVPICGAVNPDRLNNAKGVKFMIFHGENDEEVPLVCGREAYKALNSAGATVEYVEFAGVGHECWDDAFNYPTLMSWLFSQQRALDTENMAESYF